MCRQSLFLTVRERMDKTVREDFERNLGKAIYAQRQGAEDAGHDHSGEQTRAGFFPLPKAPVVERDQ